MISQVTAVNPVLRDVVLLIILFLMVIGTLYVYFRLRTGTLRRVRHLLQERVDIKTKQLTQKNVELEKLSLVASKTDNAVLIADEKGIIEWVNDGFFRMTGAPPEIVGKNISSISIYHDVEKVLNEVSAEKHSKIFESSLNTNGKDVWISSTVTPIFDDDDELKKYLFVDTDITESKKMGNQIVASLKEKDILLKEIHHRVKNNLQIIISLLNLQSGYVKDEETLKTVKDGQNRVRAMALVHEKFYQAEEIGEINFQDYTEKLCYSLRQSYGQPEKDIHIIVNADGIGLDMDTAMPCGLLITEVISNSLKYAFLNRENGEIKIVMKKVGDKKVLIDMSDNGIGLPDDFSIEKSDSLGMQLISALTSQLDGELQISHNNGTRFGVTFTYPKSQC